MARRNLSYEDGMMIWQHTGCLLVAENDAAAMGGDQGGDVLHPGCPGDLGDQCARRGLLERGRVAGAGDRRPVGGGVGPGDGPAAAGAVGVDPVTRTLREQGHVTTRQGGVAMRQVRTLIVLLALLGLSGCTDIAHQ